MNGAIYKKDNAEIIGGFRIEELDKEYALCTLDGEEDNEKVKIVIFEIQEANGEKTLVDIPEEETEMVLFFYNNLKSEILKDGDKDA